MRSMEPVALVAIDLDGTLGGIGTHAAGCRDAMRALQRTGTRICLATARGMGEELVYQLGMFYGLDYLILEGGNIILEEKEGRYERISAWDTERRDEKADLRTFREEFLKAFRLVEEDGFSRMFAAPTSGRALRVFWHAEVVQVTTEDKELFAEASAEIDRIIRECGLRVVRIEYPRLGTRVEVNAARKSDAVVFLAKGEGLAPDALCAIGDSENDIDMMQVVGVPAAPGNADVALKDLVRDRGGILVEEQRTRGVTEILRMLACRKGR